MSTDKSAVREYDPEGVTCSIGGSTIRGWGADSMIAVARAEDNITPHISAIGEPTVSENPNKSGTWTLTLATSSPSVKILTSMAENKQFIDGVLNDSSDDSVICTGKNGRIQKVPDINKNKAAGEVTVVIWYPEILFE